MISHLKLDLHLKSGCLSAPLHLSHESVFAFFICDGFVDRICFFK